MEKVEKTLQKHEERITHLEAAITGTSMSLTGHLVKCECGYNWLCRSKIGRASCRERV